MKRLFFVLAAAMLLVSVGVQADVVEVTYVFTGADLINNVFDATARHGADGSLKVYEGMRQIGPAEGTAVGATFLSGNYLTKFNQAWDEAVEEGRVLSLFHLSGNNGYAGQWGEDYKPFEWVSGTAPDGWVFSIEPDSSPNPAAHTSMIPVWQNETGGLVLTDPNLADEIFTVTVKFDTEDMWWGNPNDYLYGCNTAPNSIYGLTMYFNSWFSEPGGDYENRYVGNMFAEAVPEPMSLLVIATGLGSLVGYRRFRK